MKKMRRERAAFSASPCFPSFRCCSHYRIIFFLYTKNRPHPIRGGPGQCVKKVPFSKKNVIQSRKAAKNPHPKLAVLSQLSEKAQHFGERIATPVCALARNDTVFRQSETRHLLQVPGYSLLSSCSISTISALGFISSAQAIRAKVSRVGRLVPRSWHSDAFCRYPPDR